MIDLKVDTSRRICMKMLRDSEIDRSAKSNETHIGLFKDSVNLEKEYRMPSLLIHKNISSDTLSVIKPIVNKSDGSLRSPAIKTGGRNHELIYDNKSYESTVRKIKQIINNEDIKSQHKFFIIWGHLTNERLFIILYSDKYDIDNNVKTLLKFLAKNEIYRKSLIGVENTDLNKRMVKACKDILKRYNVEDSISQNIELIKNDIPTTRFFTKQEINDIQKIGIHGEELIAKYLHYKKVRNEIKDFFWRSNIEPGADHDFEITNLKGETEFIEVKSTINAFKSPFYWSKNEIRLFINNSGNYTIKRVSNVFKKDKAFFCSGQNMHTLKEKLAIPGIAFDGATVYPNKIDIKWEKKIYLKNFF